MNCTLQLTFNSGSTGTGTTGTIQASSIKGILLTGAGGPLGQAGTLILNTDQSATGDFVIGQMISQ
jgi:type IV secretory pathway ATPase VirB11/archaellum biosynthesis ATPase